MEEFAEIDPGCFKIEIAPHENGGCAIYIEPSEKAEFKGIATRPIRVIKLIVNGSGKILEIPKGWDSPFLYTSSTYLASDCEGLFGRECPSCKSYFRTDCLSDFLFCSYCAYRADVDAFTTKNQRLFMHHCWKAIGEAFSKRIKTTIDLNDAVKALPNNRPAWAYSEKQRQNKFKCGKCNVVFDILGEYGNCPSCGKRNYRLVFNKKINSLDERFKKAVADVKDQVRQEEEWKDLLSRCVSLFDSVANDMCDQLLRLPAIPKRKKELGKMSFQNIRNANDRFKEWYGFEILAGFSEEEIGFIHLMFNRRHLVIHNESRVDQKYLDDTKDTAVELNQAIRVQSQEINRLIELIRRSASNLIGGYESFQ